MKKRVVITGVGVISPVGNTAQDFWSALKEGKSGTGPLTQLDASKFPSKVAAEVKGFDATLYMTPKDARKNDIFVQFAVAGAKMALQDASFDIEKENARRCGVIIGSGIGGLRVIENQHNILLEKGPSRLSPFMIPMLICNMAAGMVAIETKFQGPNVCPVTACATGTHAIGDALKIIERGDADVILAGGTESCITELGYGGFCSMKALSTHNDTPESASRPFDATRSGFVMGEGAGIVVLEELEHAIKRGAPIYCEVSGYGLTCDAYHIAAPDATGESAAVCMKNAMLDAELNPEDITYINAHGTSTSLNDATETKAIKIALGIDIAKKVQISSTKSMTGHLLGAAGGVETIACAYAIRDGIIPPTINYSTPDPDCDLDYTPNEARKVSVKAALSNSLGFGGHNATLAFKKYVS